MTTKLSDLELDFIGECGVAVELGINEVIDETREDTVGRIKIEDDNMEQVTFRCPECEERHLFTPTDPTRKKLNLVDDE